MKNKSLNEECHIKIRERVIEESLRIAEETWPAAVSYVHKRLAVRAIIAALMQLDPSGNFSRCQD